MTRRSHFSRQERAGRQFTPEMEPVYPGLNQFRPPTLWTCRSLFLESNGRWCASVSNQIPGVRLARELTQAQLHAVVDAALLVSVIATDEQGTITLFNPGAERMLGYRAGEMVGRRTPLVIHLASEMEEHGQRLSAQFGRPVQGFDALVERARRGDNEEREWTYVRKDGRHLTVSLAVSAILDPDRNIAGFLGIATDITERKRAERDLALQHAATFALAESATIAQALSAILQAICEELKWQVAEYWEADLPSRGLRLKVMLYAPGFNIGEFESVSCQTNIAPGSGLAGRVLLVQEPAWIEDVQTDANFLRAAAARSAGLHAALAAPVPVLRGPTGVIAFLSTERRVRDDSLLGTVAALGCHLGQFIERKRTEEALKQSQEEQIRIKNEFVSHVSHELRTPLSAISWAAGNLLEDLAGGSITEQGEQLELIQKNAGSLAKMIDDLLDATRADAGKLRVEPRRILVTGLIHDVLVTCHAGALEKRIALRAQVPQRLPAAWADPERTRQVLINLVGNAIKFTPEEGEVQVGVRLAPEDDQTLQLSVADTGPGISRENHERVFQRLFQVSGSEDGGRRGLGLGLYISKQLVERQGGRIWVESELGKGSTFWFTLPVFSMLRICAPLLSPKDQPAASVALIAVYVFAPNGEEQVPAEVDAHLRGLLRGCVLADRDVVSPPLAESSAAGPVLVLARTDRAGGDVVGSRIQKRLEHDPVLRGLKHRLSLTMIDLPKSENGTLREQDLKTVLDRIEEFITALVR